MREIGNDPSIRVSEFFDPGYPDPYHRKAHVFVNWQSTDITVSYYGEGNYLTVTRGAFNTLGIARWDDWAKVAEIIERETSK